MDFIYNNKLKNKLFKYVPYILMFITCILLCELLFLDGFPSGEDTTYHFANIYDMYLSIKEGKSLYISSNIIQGLGYGKGLFYSPLSHLNVAILAIFLEPFKISLLNAYKITIFLSIYISGIFTYLLLKKMTKKNIVSLIASFIYMAGPYRLFTFYCRNAFTEAFALQFVPLFFLGLYEFIHIKTDEIKSKPFLIIIISASLLYFSHNITALFSYLFGVIYLLFYIDKIIKNLKNKRYLIYSLVSVCLILGFSSLLLFTSLKLYSLNIYNVSYPDRMNTSLDNIINNISRNASYTGFLNYEWLFSNYSEIYNESIAYKEVILYLVVSFVYVIFDYFLSKVKYINKGHQFLSSLFYLTVMYILYKTNTLRVEAFYSSLFLILLVIILYTFKDSFNKKIEYKYSRNAIAYVSLLIVMLILVKSRFVWSILPKSLYVIQFGWRINGICWFVLSILIALILSKVHKEAMLAIVTLCSILPLVSQANLEKRLAYENLPEDADTTTLNYEYRTEINDKYFLSNIAVGHNREYLPFIYSFNEEEGYESKYSNSLYKMVRYQISNANIDYDLSAVVLSGKANISNYCSCAPKVEFDVAVEEDNTLIQVPLLYYPGYEVIVNDGTNTYKVNLEDESSVDYLVSFRLDKGTYSVKINYVGMRSTNIAKNLFGLSLIGLNLFIICDYIYLDKKYLTNYTIK